MKMKTAAVEAASKRNRENAAAKINIEERRGNE